MSLDKPCITCKHMKEDDFLPPVCKKYISTRHNYVYGTSQKIELFCNDVRSKEDLCGAAGRGWEQKQESPKPASSFSFWDWFFGWSKKTNIHMNKLNIHWPRTKTNGLLPWYTILWRLCFLLPAILAGVLFVLLTLGMTLSKSETEHFINSFYDNMFY